jgi:hypothetical protein
VTEAELVANRPHYTSSHVKRESLALVLDRHGRHRIVTLEAAPPAISSAPATDALFSDIVFEAKLGAYLKATQEWAPADQAPPAERHFISKKRRARLFEARPDVS